MNIFDNVNNEMCSMNKEELAALADKIINEHDGVISVKDFIEILKEENK